MGFIGAGYQLKEFRKAENSFKFCRQIVDGKVNDVRKRRKTVTKVNVGYARIHELPVEILQRIFVLSGNHGLCEVNRFFYGALRPNSFLLHEYIREQFYHDLNGCIEIAGTVEKLPCLWAVDENVFMNAMFSQFLKDNREVLKNVVHFAETGQVEEIKNERMHLFKNSYQFRTDLLHLESTKRDFPRRFYEWHEVYFENDIQDDKPIYNQFILELSMYFELKQPYYVLENIIHWFFNSGQQGYNVNHLFCAVALVSHVSSIGNKNSFDNVIPLIELLRGMYWENNDRLPILLLLNTDMDEEAISRRKIRVAQRFIKRFYTQEEQRCELLSQDVLWDFLVDLKEKDVMKFVVDNGGQPSFNVL